MREIKFRAFIDKKSAWPGAKEYGMFTGFSFKDIYAGRDEANTTCEDGRAIEEPQWDKIILMQFTGLLDKDGKEIYEGDILRAPEGCYVVAWEEMRAGWFANFNGQVDSGFGCSTATTKGLEVIGNIHENPELLK